MDYKEKSVDSQKDLLTIKRAKNFILVKAKFGPSKITKIPLNLNKDLAFFAGAIIGDGHLRKHKLQILIELTNYSLLNELQTICLRVFKRKFNLSKEIVRPNKKLSKQLIMDSKAIHNLMNQVFEIPIGKKSDIVIVPKQIQLASKTIKIAFLRGIMLTEGGKRRRGYGMSTASKDLQEGICQLLREVGIESRLDKWTHKRYKKTYYGLVFKQEQLYIIMGRCRSGQTGVA